MDRFEGLRLPQAGRRPIARGSGLLEIGRGPASLRFEPGRAVERPLGRFQRYPGTVDARLKHLPLRFHVPDLDLGAIKPCTLDRHPCPGDLGGRPRLGEASLVGLGVELRQGLALGDLVIEIGKQLGDLPRKLRANLHRHHRGKRSGHGDPSLDVASLDGRRHELVELRCSGGRRAQC